MPSPSRILVLVLILAANAAHAERADRDKPIHLEADSLTYDEANKVGTYSGRVALTQGTLVLKADRIVLRQDAKGDQFATAVGSPVSFRQKRQGKDDYIEGYANRMEYDGKADKIELVGSARLVRGADELRGGQISYDSNTEFFRVTGSADGGRVRAVIMPKSASDAAKPAGR